MDQDATSILLACLSYASGTTNTERLAHIPACEWKSVAELAQEHTIAPLLYHQIKQKDIAIPVDVEKELRSCYLKNTGRNIRLYRELGTVLKRLQEKNIPIIVLKGAYLAESVYDNRRLRVMADIDLLVRKNDLEFVEQALLLMGWRKENPAYEIGRKEKKHFLYSSPKCDLNLEIHWFLFESKYPFQIDMESLWSRARPVTIEQVPVFTLTSEDLLLYLCLHSVYHRFKNRISMFYDIGEVVRKKGMELDWEEIYARAQQWRALQPVYTILRLAQELLDVPIPTDWLDTHKPASFDESYLILARQDIFASYIDKHEILATQGTRSKDPQGFGSNLMWIFGHFLPSRRSLAELYHVSEKSKVIYLYYPVRWKEILVRIGTVLWRLVRGKSKPLADAVRYVKIEVLYKWLISG